MENTTTNTTTLNLEAASKHFETLGEAGSAVLYKICQPEASPADIASALGQKLDKDGKPRSTDIRVSGISQLIQAGFIVTAAIPEGGLKPVRRSTGGTAAAIAAAKAEAEAVKAEAEATALATVTAAALAVLKATNGDDTALGDMPAAAVAAALKQWEAAEEDKRHKANAEAAALLAKCAEAAGVEAAALLEWIEAAKAKAEAEARAAIARAEAAETKKAKKA